MKYCIHIHCFDIDDVCELRIMACLKPNYARRGKWFLRLWSVWGGTRRMWQECVIGTRGMGNAAWKKNIAVYEEEAKNSEVVCSE